MTFEERWFWLTIGCVLGFLLGYVTSYVQGRKQEKDEVNPSLDSARSRDEQGIMRYPIIADVMLLLVICVTVYAAFASQDASNDVKENQKQIVAITKCNQKFLRKTIVALNERTTYTQDQAQANIDLQKAQAEFLSVVLAQPPMSEEAGLAAFQKYFNSLNAFIEVSEKSKDKTAQYPYPTRKEVRNCLARNSEGDK